ncbi:MAG: ribonuclease HI [Sphaerochaetaceae bacterium]
MEKQLTIYTDGGCLGNPGVGAWAFVLSDGQEVVEKAGKSLLTTNNRMELLGVIRALEYVLSHSEKPTKISLYTDSQYVKRGITEWIHNWKRNGWRTAVKKEVKNREFWMALDRLAEQLNIEWHWVPGHAGIALNERCDELVKEAMNSIG